MKTFLFTTLLLGFVVTTFADSRSELDDRVRRLMTEFDSLQANGKARIPPKKLDKAAGIVVMDRGKGGLVFGFEKGSGVALTKDQGKWGAFSFMSSHESSFGAQIGGKSTFCVILLMNRAARDRLLQSDVDFGGEAVGTGGSKTKGRKKNFTKQPGVLVFGKSKGLYGGAVIKGGSVVADDKANHSYYGQLYSIKDILFDKNVEPSETATEFAKKLEKATKAH